MGLARLPAEIGMIGTFTIEYLETRRPERSRV